MRLRDEEVRGQHFLNDGANLRQRQMRLPWSAPFVLEKTVGEGRQDHMALPSRQAAAFEMSFEVIGPELALEFLVLLFDRPSLMGQTDQGAQRRDGRQIHQVVPDAIAASQFPFAEQPDFGCESSFRTPIVRGCDPDRTEAGAPGRMVPLRLHGPPPHGRNASQAQQNGQRDHRPAGKCRNSRGDGDGERENHQTAVRIRGPHGERRGSC